MAVVLILVEVIGTHQAPRAGFHDSRLEGRQVNLMQGAVADDDVHLMAIFLVVVQRIVFYTGCNALRLQSLDVRYYHARG